MLDEDGRPVPGTLVELWQCNSAGRYHHPVDQHDAPLDPNFTGVGQVVSGADGSWRFVTIKPGAYPWRNTPNAWRPAHIHFGIFGPGFVTRVVTQMYFPGDPLLALDPIYQSTADTAARERLIADYDPNLSEAEWALGYRWDIVLRGRRGDAGRGRLTMAGQADPDPVADGRPVLPSRSRAPRMERSDRPEPAGRAHRDRRSRHRRRRRRRSRRADRVVAGQRRRSL